MVSSIKLQLIFTTHEHRITTNKRSKAALASYTNVTQARNYDSAEITTPVLRVIGDHFGRFRTSIALTLGICLWVIPLSLQDCTLESVP